MSEELDNPVSFEFRGDTITFDYPIPDEHSRKKMMKINNFYEWRLLRSLPKFFNGGTAIDVGAFIGTHTVFFKKYCRFDKVISFEPNKLSFKYLKRNCDINNVDSVLINKAVLDINTKGIEHITPEANIGNPKLGCIEIIPNENGDVEVVRLDDFNFEDVRLIKIDVEGSECNVINGSLDLINKYKPMIVAECFDNKDGETIVSDRYDKIDNLLKSLGYKNIYSIGYNGVWKYDNQQSTS
jgi:FkbM family methyltransferase